MCQVANSSCKLEAIKSPQSFDESPEAFLEMHITCKCGRKLIVFVVLRRQVFEEVEDQAVLVVQCGLGGYDTLVEVVKLLWCLGRISFAP